MALEPSSTRQKISFTVMVSFFIFILILDNMGVINTSQEINNEQGNGISNKVEQKENTPAKFSNDSKTNVIQNLFNSDVFTVRSIISHYPYRNSNSQTTLYVYEKGDSGHTKEVLCMFPPDFQLDNNLSTPKLDEMAKPKLILSEKANQILEMRNSNMSDLDIMEFFIKQDQGFEEGVNRVRTANPNMGALERAQMPRVLLNQYYSIPSDIREWEKENMLPVPPLTGIRKVRIGKKAKEYAFGEIGYLCEEVE